MKLKRSAQRALDALRLDSPHAQLQRLLTQSARTGLLKQASLRALPSLLKLVRQRGLGAHMLHALWAELSPQRLAIVDAHHNALTYQQANAQIERLADTLHDRYHVQRHTPVALMTENRAEQLIAWIATMRLGAWAVHVSYRATASELANQLQHADARIIFVDHARLPIVQQAIAEHDLALTVITLGAPESCPTLLRYETLVDPALHTPSTTRSLKKQPSSNIVYTSGTTGRPKGAMRDLSSFGAVELGRLLERLDLRAADRHLVVAPIYHSGAQALALIHLALGSTLYLAPRFDPRDTLRQLSEDQIHSIFLVPTMLQRLLDLSEHARYPTPDLRVVISGAAPLPHALRLEAIARFGAPHLYDFYGATELGWVTLIRGDEMLTHVGSVGRPLAGQQLAIFDEAGEGQKLSSDQIGMVYVRSPQHMQGYLRDEPASQALQRSEWLTVEDLGRLDADGYLYIEGRARDMIISGGVNIYPAELEERLLHHPDVRDAAIVGLPDELFGERVAAYVVLRQECTLDEAALHAWLAQDFARHKLPRQWHTLDELPRNPTGKILKRLLREQLSGSVAAP